MVLNNRSVAIANKTWSMMKGLDRVASPGVLVDVDRVAENLDSMVAMVEGETDRLRPHVKTHKIPALIRMQVDRGIRKFKTATIVEASMVAENGGTDVLLAYQPVGPNQSRLLQLASQHPDVTFSAIVDDEGIASELSNRCREAGLTLRLFIDVDCGMHRTGIPPGEGLTELRRHLESLPAIEYAGMHIYDGHLHQPSLQDRQRDAGEIISWARTHDASDPSPSIIGGGSPTFACWAQESDFECSPGTTVFWDGGYGGSYGDLPFSIAAALVTRVISKPGSDRLCFDLGYKSIASEMPLESRVVIPDIPDAKFVGHSEEHLVVESPIASTTPIGATFLAFPRHVCPTIALHDYVAVVRDGSVTEELWPVTARGRILR